MGAFSFLSMSYRLIYAACLMMTTCLLFIKKKILLNLPLLHVHYRYPYPVCVNIR